MWPIEFCVTSDYPYFIKYRSGNLVQPYDISVSYFSISNITFTF
jgi:hypothetical protein